MMAWTCGATEHDKLLNWPHEKQNNSKEKKYAIKGLKGRTQEDAKEKSIEQLRWNKWTKEEGNQ